MLNIDFDDDPYPEKCIAENYNMFRVYTQVIEHEFISC